MIYIIYDYVYIFGHDRSHEGCHHTHWFFVDLLQDSTEGETSSSVKSALGISAIPDASEIIVT